MSESLREQEILWEHDLQASVFTALLSSPKLSQVFLFENTVTKIEKQLAYFCHQNVQM